MSMSDWPDYELLDFGDGRKLERFGEWTLDRPSPTAVGVAKSKPQAWRTAIARFDGDRAADGKWSPAAMKWPRGDQTLNALVDARQDGLADRGLEFADDGDGLAVLVADAAGQEAFDQGLGEAVLHLLDRETEAFQGDVHSMVLEGLFGGRCRLVKSSIQR